jgi:hypothetical protein
MDISCTGARRGFEWQAGSYVHLNMSVHWSLRRLQLPFLANCKVGRTPSYVETCNSQDTMSATWRKERSTVETNEIMKTAAHRSKLWCWRQLLSFLYHVLMLVLTQLVCGRPKTSYNCYLEIILSLDSQQELDQSCKISVTCLEM